MTDLSNRKPILCLDFDGVAVEALKSTVRIHAAMFETGELDCAKLDGPESEISRLKQWIADLQSGMYVNCVYCGHRYGPEDLTPVTMADALKQHVAQCPEHPMSKCVKTLEAASHGLRSYQYGNSSPDLAKEMADKIDAVLAEMKGAKASGAPEGSKP